MRANRPTERRQLDLLDRSLADMGWRGLGGRPVRGEPKPNVAIVTEQARRWTRRYRNEAARKHSLSGDMTFPKSTDLCRYISSVTTLTSRSG
jgi:hypothetical protein